MKLNTLTCLCVSGLVLTLTSTACRPKRPAVTPLPRPGATGENPALAQGEKLGELDATTAAGIPSNPAGSHDGWIARTDVFQGDTVHFAYDSSVVRPEEAPKIAAVADYLKSNSSDAVRIEGHCDERGTEEYNRALGERRALALREELVRLGIDPARVDTTTYGKDRPVDPGHDESAWKHNRRGESVLLTPPNQARAAVTVGNPVEN